MSRTKVVIFDYDGVIADSFECFFGAYKRACLELGLENLANKETMLELFENNFYSSVYKKLDKANGKIFLKTLGKFLKEAGTNYILFDGMKEVLEKLNTVAKLFIVTANISEVVKKHLEKNAIKAIPEILGADVSTSKVERINKIKQDFSDSEYFFVTDTLGDIIEAKSCGAKVFAVLWGWHDLKTLSKGEPDYTIRSPTELLNFFIKKEQ